MKWLLAPCIAWMLYACATASYGVWSLPLTLLGLCVVLGLVGADADRARGSRRPSPRRGPR